MRIAHLSDLHLHPAGALRAADLRTRRLFGALNLYVLRAGAYSEDVARAAVEAVREAGVDHVVVTGDLTNLALPSEFALAVQVLRPFGGVDRLSVIPGNHDFYTPESVRDHEFGRWFGYTLWPDGDGKGGRAGAFPVVKDLPDNVTLVLLGTAGVVPPACAFGRVGPVQVARLADALDDARRRGRFPIVALHHNLHRRGTLSEATGRLLDRREVAEVLVRHGARLVLHGHDHREHDMVISDGPDRPGTRVIGCGSTSADPRRAPPGQFNICEVSGGRLKVERWRIRRAGGRFEPFTA